MSEIKFKPTTYLVSNKRVLAQGLTPLSSDQITDAIQQVVGVLGLAGGGTSVDKFGVLSVIEPPKTMDGATMLLDNIDDTPVVLAKLTEAAAEKLRDRHRSLVVEPDEDLSFFSTDGMLDFHTTMLGPVPLDDEELVFRIRAQNSAGEPIAGARVSVSGSMWYDQALTDVNGIAKIVMLGETTETLSSVTVKPASGYWSRIVQNPSLSINQLNDITLLSLAEGQGGLIGFPYEQTVGWGVVDLGVPPAEPGLPNVKLAVIDSGIDNTHLDLLHATNGRAFGIDGEPDDDSFHLDSSGHGTHVAGSAAGYADNNFGIFGVAPNVELHGLRVFPQAKISKLVKALRYCREKQIDVVNMSLGMKRGSELLSDELDKCVEAGIVLVAAAGNSGKEVNYPAAFESVIAVAAVGKKGSFPANSTNAAAETNDFDHSNTYFIARFSCRGPQINVAAPGVAVISTYPSTNGTPFAELSGTSMASPHVTGFVARMLQHNRELREMPRTHARVAAIKAALLSACRPMGEELLWGKGMPDWLRFKADDQISQDGGVDNLVEKLRNALAIAESLR